MVNVNARFVSVDDFSFKLGQASVVRVFRVVGTHPEFGYRLDGARFFGNDYWPASRVNGMWDYDPEVGDFCRIPGGCNYV